MKTVLIVDDDADIRALLKDAVSAMGLTPIEAMEGQRALDLMGEVQVDLVLLDWMLPGKDGRQVLAEIRRKENMETVPVIMLTAREGLQDKVSALEGGADDYITKPFEFRELQARIKAFLRIRELNLSLKQKNQELLSAQEQIVEQEKKLLLLEIAGTAAHKLGQPLSAIVLNCHLLQTLPKDDPRWQRAIEAIKSDTRQMTEMLEQLKAAPPGKKTDYYGARKILEVED